MLKKLVVVSPGEYNPEGGWLTYTGRDQVKKLAELLEPHLVNTAIALLGGSTRCEYETVSILASSIPGIMCRGEERRLDVRHNFDRNPWTKDCLGLIEAVGEVFDVVIVVVNEDFARHLPKMWVESRGKSIEGDLLAPPASAHIVERETGAHRFVQASNIVPF